MSLSERKDFQYKVKAKTKVKEGSTKGKWNSETRVQRAYKES